LETSRLTNGFRTFSGKYCGVPDRGHCNRRAAC
jgi:hypothetical protein